MVVHLATKWARKWKGSEKMKSMKNIVMVVVLLMAVGVVIAIKRSSTPVPPEPPAAPTESSRPSVAAPAADQSTPLPRLVDLGADKCVPCKMMAPILEELKETFAGQLKVDFIDVWKDQGAGEQYGIRMIPTQIFYAADGKELFRHEGFFSREAIMEQWAKLGFTFTASGDK